MIQKYITRTLEPVLKRAAEDFPVVILTGPRQSGKTTLLKHLFAENYAYISLEPPDIRAAASEDPRGFLAMYPPPAILDEIQYAPDLLSYIKERVDANRTEHGQYLLTGSQNLLLMQQVTESLAGRTAILRLLPLSQRETLGVSGFPFPWESDKKRALHQGLTYELLWEKILHGNYPELIADPKKDVSLWYASYIQTYLERDVRSLRQVGDLTTFQNFVRAIAARSGGLLNLTEVSRDIGVAVNTAKAWLSVLEATYQIIILQPYFANVGKRLVKTPKLYFTDVGMLCHLVGLKDPHHAASSPMSGAIFETLVLTEIFKTYFHQGREPRVYFWRTATGTEVDILIEVNGRLVPIEVKLSATPRPAMAKGIIILQADLGKKVAPGYIVHPGDVRLPLGQGATALPFAEL
ncbi:MAG: ATP-binding protein [Candidatus Bipolaricaulota bacterium]|nr:ATP-binding protein [Candidatus Bipolaricaulota bacterium]